MTETKYGVISDVHQDPRVVPLAIDVLKKEGAEKLLVNGDIGGHYGNLGDSQRYTAFILDSVGKSGLESFVQPGSHESLLGYESVIEHFSDEYKGRVVDTLKVPKVEQNGHHLVFLPGSDFVCGGEYRIGSDEGIPTGKYVQIKEGLAKIDNLGVYVDLLRRGFKGEAMHYSNMYDLRKLVTDPDKTIIVCHVPRRFENLENCVDMAEFGEATIDFLLNGKIIRSGSIFPLDNARKIAEAGYPVRIKKENRGNKELAKLYGELGIRKAVTGHFHESVGRANDLQGNHVNDGESVEELFWMGSYLDGMKAGILTVNENRVSYRNIDLRNYFSE